MCWRSTEVVNHHVRYLDQQATAPKHHRVSPKPKACPRAEQSEKSNWDSSPGAVSMGTDTWGAGRKRGPRSARTFRTTDG